VTVEGKVENDWSCSQQVFQENMMEVFTRRNTRVFSTVIADKI